MRSQKAFYCLASAGAVIALAGCETVAEEVTEAVGYEYVAMLSPMAGGSGAGKAEISLDDSTNILCTDLELSAGVTMTSGSIIGPAGAVADIDVPDAGDIDDNDSDDCDNVSDAVVDGIRANPGAYRVHIDAGSGDLHGTLMKEE